MKKRLRFFICAALLAGTAWSAWKFFETPSLPEIPGYNVLYLTADSFNKKHLPMYGYAKNTMPYLTSLSGEAAVFDQMINPSGWTNENLIALFSSLSSPVHKVETRGRNLDARWITPIEILREYGYRAPRLEAWQGDQNHAELGFEEVTSMHPADWLRKNGRGGRFFLFYQFLQPHLPYNGDFRDSEIFNRFVDSATFRGSEHRKRIYSTVGTNSIVKNDGRIVFRPEDKPAIDALYDGELALFDAEIERTVRALDELGLRDNTVIIVSADHGEELLEHGFVGHASTSRAGHLYDEIINVPFLICFPKKISPGFIRSQVRGIDVLPTVLDLLEIPLPSWIEGRSLMPVIRGRETAHRTAFIQTSRAGYGEPDPANVTDRIRSVRTGEWKLIHHYYQENPTRFELYDLRTDSAEHHNVLAENPRIASELQQSLLQWILASEKAVPPDPAKYVRKSQYERLREYLSRKPLRTDFSGVPSPPIVAEPRPGDVVSWSTSNGTAIMKWSGAEDVPYVIEYKVGEGDYKLDGTIDGIVGTEKIFGPFPRKYWDTYLTLFSPYRIRISIDKEPREWSPWIEFKVETAQ